MELYVNPTITGFRQEVDGTIKELKIGSNKEDAYANIIGQAESNLEDNKTVSITSNGEVEITPTHGKDGMKKVTATVNVSGGSATAYAWKSEGDTFYFSFDKAPETLENQMGLSVESEYIRVYSPILEEGETYTKISDDEFTISSEGGSSTFIRFRASGNKDFTLWQVNS